MHHCVIHKLLLVHIDIKVDVQVQVDILKCVFQLNWIFNTLCAFLF